MPTSYPVEFKMDYVERRSRLTTFFRSTLAIPHVFSYPVRVHIAPPLESYSRLKVFFRAWYAILALVIRYAMAIVIGFVGLISWFAIVFTGRQPESLQNALYFALSYTTRADGLIFLITETYPTLGDTGAPTVPAAQPAV